jgi:3-mercaptopyruvate sulfurtransferase SseA
MDKGYRKVRPLAGGLEAWLEAGKPHELVPGEGGTAVAAEFRDAQRR